MTIKEIAAEAAGILQADEVLSALTADDGQDLESDADVKSMLLCANLAVKEARADGFPVVREVTAIAENKRIPLSSLPEFGGIKSLLFKGRRSSFSVDTRGISVPNNGTYAVAYYAAARDCEPNDEAEIGVFADKTVLGYLTARDYCLMTGRTDEAAIWDQRYATESERVRLNRRAALPVREWR